MKGLEIMITVKLIIVCLGYLLAIILGITYLKNRQKDKEEQRYRKELNAIIKTVDGSERRFYAYACPLRSYILTDPLNEDFGEDQYPWLLQYNSLPREQRHRLADVLSDYFGIVDRQTLNQAVNAFIESDSRLNLVYRSSVILFMLTSAADLSYISRVEMMQEGERLLLKPINNEIEFLSEFLLGFNKGSIKRLFKRNQLFKHMAHLAKDEFSPLNYSR